MSSPRFDSSWRSAPSIPHLAREAVALAVGGEDVDRMLGVLLEFLAQAQHVGVHRACGRKLLVAPHLVEEAVARDHLAAMLDQIAEKIELLARQPHLAPRAKGLAAAEPDPHVAEGELLELLAWPGATQHRADAGQELAEAEGLGHV